MSWRMSSLSGKTIVFTGTLSSMTRNEATAFAINANATVSNTVSFSTDYLVVGGGLSKASTAQLEIKDKKIKVTSKLVKASEFGVPILTEADFIRMAASDQQARKANRRIIPAPKLKPQPTPYMDIIPELDID